MYRIIYISTARAGLTATERDALLALSRRNNAAVGVTGLLVIGGRRFLQTLEGPEAAVTATFERIRRDPRHFAIVSLDAQPITQRAFAGWAMGYQPGGAVGGGDVAAAVAALIEPITDPVVRGYFSGFAATHAAA